MKNINSLILIVLIGMLSFAQSAFAQVAVDKARVLSYLESDAVAISPYAQAALNDSYTFIGISHPSLDTAIARIGVAVEVVGMDTLTGTQAGRSSVFTVNGGETHRVFIVNQGHASINKSNAAFTDSRTHLIAVSDTPQFGAVRVTTVGETPNTINAAGTAAGALTGAGVAITCSSVANIGTAGCGFSNLNQLSMWGIVYSEAAGTGFAMEFIGDMHDSTIITGHNTGHLKLGTRGGGIWTGSTATNGDLATGATSHRPGAGVN